MNVPLSSPDITENEIEIVKNVLKSQFLSLGPKLKEFEEKVANFVGTKHAIAVNSGTSGLHLIVRSLDIGDGDEVVTTPFSFVASSNCILFEKARPVFVDIEQKTMNINPDLIEKAITPRTKAILPVHVFGHPADMKKIRDIANKYGLHIIEDACEAIGAEYYGRKAGSLGDAAVFAFYPNKQITTGEGGIIITDNDNIARLCKSMRNQGRGEIESWLAHERLGYNYRLNELSCALGIAQMERINEIIEKRAGLAAVYNDRFAVLDGVETQQIDENVKMSWFVYVIRLNRGINRDQVLTYLREKGVQCRPYFTPIHLQPFYRDMFGYRVGDFPVTEDISSRTIALPFFNNLSEDQIDYVVQVLKEALKVF